MGDLELVGKYGEQPVKEINTVAGRLNAMADIADSVEVEDDDSLIEAAAMINELSATTALVSQIIEPFKKRAHASWKATIADEKAIVGRAEAAVASLKQKVASYRVKTQKALREAQRAVVEETDSKALTVAEKEAALTDNVGVGYRETWKAECHSIVDLCRAVAEGKAPAELVTFNQSAGNKLARSLRELTGNIPGLKAHKETSVVKR